MLDFAFQRIKMLCALRAAGQSREEALEVLYECHVDAYRLQHHLPPNVVEAGLEGIVWIYGEDSPEGREAKADLAVQADQQAAREEAARAASAKQDQMEKQKKEIRDLPETPPPPIVPLW